MYPADLLNLDPGYDMRAEDGGFGPNICKTRDDGGQGDETLGGLDPLFSKNPAIPDLDPGYGINLDPGNLLYPAYGKKLDPGYVKNLYPGNVQCMNSADGFYPANDS